MKSRLEVLLYNFMTEINNWAGIKRYSKGAILYNHSVIAARVLLYNTAGRMTNDGLARELEFLRDSSKSAE